MEIIVKDDWDISSSGVVAGTIYFKFEERFFPCFEYSDFPVICLKSWLDIVCELKRIRCSRARYQGLLLFFDGPYITVISYDPDNDSVSAAFYDDYNYDGKTIVGDKLVGIEIMSSTDFFNIIIQTAIKVKAIAKHHRIGLPDMQKKLVDLQVKSQT